MTFIQMVSTIDKIACLGESNRRVLRNIRFTSHKSPTQCLNGMPPWTGTPKLQMRINQDALASRNQDNDTSLVIGDVVDGDIHAVCNLGVFDGPRVCLVRCPISRDDLAIGVHGDSVRSDFEVIHTCAAVGNSLLGLVQGLEFASLATDLFQVLEVALPHRRHVATAEDTDLEILRLLLAVLKGNFRTRPFEVIQGLEDDALGADVAGNSFCVTVVGDQFMGRGQIDTVDVSVTAFVLALVVRHGSRDNLRDLRSTAGQVDLLRAGFPSHADNLTTGGTADDTVVHEQDIAVLELGLHGVQLAPDSLLPSFLFGHDERAEDITVLDEAMTVGLVQILGDVGGGGSGGFGNRDDHVDILDDLGTQDIENPGAETVTHTLATAVHTDPIDHRVRTGKVHIFENIGSIVFLRCHLAEDGLPTLFDNDRLTRLDITVVREPELVQSN